MAMPLAAWWLDFQKFDLAVKCLVSWDVIWQPGYVAKEGTAMTTDDLGDRRETGGHGHLIDRDELMPLDLQQLSLALHVEGLFQCNAASIPVLKLVHQKGGGHLQKY